MTNQAFVLRVSWEHDEQQWVILLIPANGEPSLVFTNLEGAFLYIAQRYTDYPPDDLPAHSEFSSGPTITR